MYTIFLFLKRQETFYNVEKAHWLFTFLKCMLLLYYLLLIVLNLQIRKETGGKMDVVEYFL